MANQNDLIRRLADDLLASESCVALTGAGISVESGIPPFRGKGGLWERFDPMEVAHIDSFLRDPARVWDLLLREMHSLLSTARPNAAHLGLARLEKAGILSTVITQNVDGLHQAAGSTDVIEFHGNFAWQRCMECEKTYSTPEVDLSTIPPLCACGGILRPECVFFGEAIPEHELARSFQLAARCGLMLVVGTSAVVQPSASLPQVARQHGALVVEINREPTHLTGSVAHYSLLGRAGDLVGAVASLVEQGRG
ncbi:MAG: NAD-dependent deacylase [Deltaproteobacteria bacterium]|nr:NAD-dependent deacylase [Deltaproteobacteria bacterium]